MKSIICCLWSLSLAVASPTVQRELVYQPPSVNWSSCPTDIANGALKGVKCATLPVPIDWSHPSGDQFHLALYKIEANGTGSRIGNLFVNPGGPGGSALGLIAGIKAGVLPIGKEVRSRFDIIGVDPRGIGHSNPVRCNATIWNERVSYFPKDERSFNKMVQHNEELSRSCRNLTGPLFDHVDTTSVARDLEAVRIALGSESLNWLGISYGTQIGAAYAELFPENYRAMVLDGNVQHSQSATSNVVIESNTYETELNHFFDWCNANIECPLHGKDLRAYWDELVAQADKSPIPAESCKSKSCRSNVTGEEICFNTQPLLVKKSDWINLAYGLKNATAGDASAFSTLLAASDNDGIYGGMAVQCIDWNIEGKSFADVLYWEMLLNTTSPRTLGASQSYTIQTNCIGWIAPVANPNHVTRVKGGQTILMVNSNYDPESSYIWAVGLREEIGNAVLLTRDGDGHSSYFLEGEAQTIMDAFLVNMTLPAPGTVVKT